MDLLTVKSKFKSLFDKYKFILLIIAVGVMLMLFPSKKTTSENTDSISAPVIQDNPEAALAEILSRIKGAGRVEVMLTVSQGEQILYQTDSDLSEDQNSLTNRSDTVIVTGADRLQNGLVKQVIPPVYQGAIIVCDGADDPAVRLNIVAAVSRSTGLGADRISVLKMK